MSGSRRKPGALGPHVEEFRGYLVAMHYTPGTVREQLKVLGRLGRWMDTRGLSPAELTVAAVDQFLVEGTGGKVRRGERCTALQILDHLMSQGVVGMPAPDPKSEVEQFLDEFRDWMGRDRGLAETTMLRYENTARRFLTQRAGAPGAMTGVTSVEVNAFLLAECSRISVGSAKGRVAELRGLLRYLFLRGLTAGPLAAAVPPVAGWHDTSIPATGDPDRVQALLDSCDRGTPVGIRDLAILTLVARMGLRSVEVSRMELGDIGWRTGQITIRGKARRVDTMPLPVDAGKALAAYLADARPDADTRQRRVFLTCRAPLRPIRADLVGDVVERACRRVGMTPIGPHRLRRTLARQMLAGGVVLTDISQVLRHRDLATTAIYAKVDLNALRQVARPWPGWAPDVTGGRR